MNQSINQSVQHRLPPVLKWAVGGDARPFLMDDYLGSGGEGGTKHLCDTCYMLHVTHDTRDAYLPANQNLQLGFLSKFCCIHC